MLAAEKRKCLIVLFVVRVSKIEVLSGVRKEGGKRSEEGWGIQKPKHEREDRSAVTLQPIRDSARSDNSSKRWGHSCRSRCKSFVSSKADWLETGTGDSHLLMVCGMCVSSMVGLLGAGAE